MRRGRKPSLPYDEIILLADEGIPHAEIARRYGTSRARIGQIAGPSGRRVRDPAIIARNEAIFKRWAAGESIASLARAYDLPDSWVSNIRDNESRKIVQ